MRRRRRDDKRNVAWMLVGFYTVATIGFYAWMLKSASPEEEGEATHAPNLRVVEGGQAESAAETRKAA